MGKVRGGFVYIMMNRGGSVLYTGVTSDLMKRVTQHRTGQGGSQFAKRYLATRLVYFEVHVDIRNAIAREKQIKGWKRYRKEELILSLNPGLIDLTEEAARIQTELRLGSGQPCR